MLLEKDSSVSIHDRNILCLATEMYKISNRLSPPAVSNIFTRKNCHPYNLRLNSQFSRPLVRSVFHGTQSISYLGPVIWDILPDSYKNLPNFSVFKNRIKKWKPENCPCRLCKTYISIVGFTQAFAPVSWMKLWHFAYSCLCKRAFANVRLSLSLKLFSFYLTQMTSVSMYNVTLYKAIFLMYTVLCIDVCQLLK